MGVRANIRKDKVMVNRQGLIEIMCAGNRHKNIFNLDHNPEGELPMFCRCGEVDFNDEDLGMDFQREKRWVSITQEVEC